MTEGVLPRKTGIEALPVAFSDHSVVILRLATTTPPPTQGRSHWKMNIQLISDKVFCDTITKERDTWKQHIKYYPKPVLWWNRFFKRRIKMTFVTEGAERQRDRRTMESFYYATIRSILHDGLISTTNVNKLNELKAKLVKLRRVDMQKQLLDIADVDRFPGEQPSLYHLMRSRKRQEQRHVTTITDSHGSRHTTNKTILLTFTQFLETKYADIEVDMREAVKKGRALKNKVAQEANDAPVETLTMDELEADVKSGKNRKAPGRDGIRQEFFLKQIG
jgi:hypothetical protein